MLCGLLKELQALIAFACYNSPAPISQGASLSEGIIEDVMSSIFYGGDKYGADPNLITDVDQFMLGLNKFKGCTDSITVRTMVHLENLHFCQFRNICTVTRGYLSMLATVQLRKGYCHRSLCLELGRRFQAVYTGSNVEGGIVQL